MNMEVFRVIRSPCMGCQDRHLACHDSCKEYKEYKEKLTAVWMYRKRFKMTDSCIAEMKNRLYRKTRGDKKR